ncbi:hypothetical protein MR829_23375 [Paracoccus versutus]|uniref:hypothetical protein n=1 Tax=Paracoccus versutus TaxID=34007 RepID=UPI001FB6FB16|nr:hypothetical protein [Paracoccus versutus]MCJ1903263.1 hypothetical protein [Paracoccus versutus]
MFVQPWLGKLLFRSFCQSTKKLFITGFAQQGELPTISAPHDTVTRLLSQPASCRNRPSTLPVTKLAATRQSAHPAWTVSQRLAARDVDRQVEEFQSGLPRSTRLYGGGFSTVGKDTASAAAIPATSASRSAATAPASPVTHRYHILKTRNDSLRFKAWSAAAARKKGGREIGH